MDQIEIDEKYLTNDFRKNVGLCGIAFILFLLNIKIGNLPASYIVAGIMLIISGKYFIKNYKQKNILIGGILFLIASVISFIGSILSPLVFADIIDEVGDIVSEISALISGAAEIDVNAEINNILMKVFEYIYSLKDKLILTNIITTSSKVCSYIAVFIVGLGVSNISNSEEASEKLRKVAITVLVTGIISDIITIVNIAILFDVVPLALNLNGESLTTLIPNIIPLIILCVIGFIVGIIYFINIIILIIHIFKTQEADEEKEDVLNNK